MSVLKEYFYSLHNLLCHASGLKEQNSFYTDLLPRLRTALQDVKEFLDPFESMVDQCREKLGSSTAEQLCKRKRSKNKQKELRKQKKAVEKKPEIVNVDYEEEIQSEDDQEEEKEWIDLEDKQGQYDEEQWTDVEDEHV